MKQKYIWVIVAVIILVVFILPNFSANNRRPTFAQPGIPIQPSEPST